MAYFHSDVPGASIVELFESPEGLVTEDCAERWYPDTKSRPILC